MPEGVRELGRLRVFLRAKNDLGQTFAIAQINENDAAVRDAQFIAMMGTIKTHW